MLIFFVEEGAAHLSFVTPLYRLPGIFICEQKGSNSTRLIKSFRFVVIKSASQRNSLFYMINMISNDEAQEANYIMNNNKDTVQ